MEGEGDQSGFSSTMRHLAWQNAAYQLRRCGEYIVLTEMICTRVEMYR